MARGVDENTAIAEFRTAGLEPLEKFKNAATTWRAMHTACGREVSTTLKSVRNGRGCTLCNNNVPTEETFRERMAEYLCVPTCVYPGSSVRATFACLRCNNEFSSTWNKIKENREPGQPACPNCARIDKRKVAIDLLTKRLSDYALSRGGRLVTERVLRVKDKTEFECSNGHRWKSSAEHVVNQRAWCPYCARNATRSIQELQAIVASRQGKLLTTDYRGVDGKYDYECVLGHKFSNSFKKVEIGQWCPTCNKGRISEEVSRTTFEQLFGAPFQKERPQWLRNSRGRLMELDGANFELRLAFEYHGAQHFRKNLYIKDDAKLAQRIIDDEHKEQLCNEHGITLVILTHEMKYAEFPSEIKRQLQSSNYPVSGIDFDRPIDFSKAYVRNDRLEELRNLLAPKGIEVLSNMWLTSDTPYDLKCLSCGHIWSAPGNMFFNSRRVAGCDRCNRRKAGDKHRLAIDELRAFAADRGGELLSDTYVKSNWLYRWRCSEGHEFERRFYQMKFKETFCPYCDGKFYRPPRSTNPDLVNGRVPPR